MLLYIGRRDPIELGVTRSETAERLQVFAPASSRPRSEEEEIGVEEEDGGELAREAPDFEVLAKACRGKVRRLIKRMEGQFELANGPDRARRGIVQLAAVLGVIRTLRFVEQRPEWKRMRHELIDRADEWNLFQSAVLAVAWGPEALAPRAEAEADGEGFAELSMVIGLLAWLGWDVETDISLASQRGGLEGLEDERWYAVQLLATLGPWIVDDSVAQAVLEESVSRTPRFAVDSERWLRVQLAALQTFAIVNASPDEFGKVRRTAKPGDLVILHDREAPAFALCWANSSRGQSTARHPRGQARAVQVDREHLHSVSATQTG